MAQDRSRSGRTGGEPGGEGATPRRALEEITRKRARQSAEAQARLMGAMLIATGERGYRAVTVKDVLERYGGYRSEFYVHFPNKAACYEAAYEAGSAALAAELLTAGEEGQGWREALGEALGRLGSFLVACPAMARGLLVEVHVARGQALARHREVVERLSRAVDRARRETHPSRHSPPPLTAEFMVRAVESAAASALLCDEPRRFELAIPELTEMVVRAYFGE